MLRYALHARPLMPRATVSETSFDSDDVRFIAVRASR